MWTKTLAVCLVLALPGPGLFAEGRTVLSLDGLWQIADSVAADVPPAVFAHTVPVPGLVHLARPAFADVDRFDSKELIANRIKQQRLPESARVAHGGNALQDRNYFWYRTTFRAPARRDTTRLRIGKAQFGTAVWLNGRPLGDYPGCFSASQFDLAAAIRWEADNELVVRIGAHPGVLPVDFPAGTDYEKLRWTPGIYDRVEVRFADGPFIESVQVAPRIAGPSILVQTILRNRGPARSVELAQSVRPWRDEPGATVTAEPLRLELRADEERTVTQTIALPGARLWSPEDPYLYLLETRTDGDSVTTRFGVREVGTDAATGRLLLNGQVYYLRGSTISLHRFFEDPLSGSLPWDEAWVRRLLGAEAKRMHWNSSRFTIGPVPDRWLEIADEVGLLIQNEFFIWSKTGDRSWNGPELVRQFGDWVRDNRNHPSVAIWDACNETHDPIFADLVIPAVRRLDLSDRPWENSYNGPARPGDPSEYHRYRFGSHYFKAAHLFGLPDLLADDGDRAPNAKPAQGSIHLLNEYGWLWLNRDGTPTWLTKEVYRNLLGPDSTADQRRELQAYSLAAKTEHWRAHRKLAGVMHFTFLTSSEPGGYTSDHWIDVARLEPSPHFTDYVAEAFKPLGVNLRFYGPAVRAGERRDYPVMLVNDTGNPVAGKLRLAWTDRAGGEIAAAEADFAVPGLGRATVSVALVTPLSPGERCLVATALAEVSGQHAPTRSRRWITIRPAADTP